MKPILVALTLISALSISAPLHAGKAEQNYSPFFVFPDLLIYRPLGIAATIAGAGLFVATSPFALLANIAPPHDAFKKTSGILIDAPAGFTFNRPVGDLSLTNY